MCACAQEGERSKTRNVTFFVFSPGDPLCENAKMKDKITTLETWRVFAWRPFSPPGKDTTNRGEKAKGRHAKTRQTVNFSCFRMATFRPATRKYDTSCVAFSPPVCRIFAWRVERSPRENPPKSPFGVFSRGDLSPRQAKIRQTGAKRRKVATRKPAK